MDPDLEVLLAAGVFAAAWILISWLLFGRVKK